MTFVNQQRVSHEVDKHRKTQDAFVAPLAILIEHLIEKRLVQHKAENRQHAVGQRQPPQHFRFKAFHDQLLFGSNAAKASALSGVSLYKDVESGAAKADPTRLEATNAPTSYVLLFTR
jgi:hypothetical protein